MYWDIDHQGIHCLAKALCSQKQEPKDLVSNIFQHAQYSIIFGCDRVKTSPIESLNKGIGATYEKKA